MLAQQYSEFFSADARQNLLRVQLPRQHAGHCRQRAVACGMAVEIVVAFEVVDIDQQQRAGRHLSLLQALPMRRQRLLEAAPIQHPGQGIGTRESSQILIGLGQGQSACRDFALQFI